MYFIASLEHTPDNCWAREEHEQMAQEWIDSLDQRAEEHGVSLHGAYATPIEHMFYFVLEADSFEAVTRFLGPPFLQDHDGHIAPVLPLVETPDVVLSE